MIYEHAIAQGTVLHNLQVIRVARGNPLVYRVKCLRPHCGGEFEIDHARLTGLGFDWCQWPGCSQTAKERASRKTHPVRRGEIDPDALTIPGRVPW
jgi:hypothetical protein